MKHLLHAFIFGAAATLLPVAAATAQTAVPPPEMRTYTNESGIQLRAVLISVDKNGNVVLKLESGVMHLIKLARLSATDQTYLKAYGADGPGVAPASAGKTPAAAGNLSPAPPVEDVPKSFKQALREWSWTWTGPQSNTVVTFQDWGKLVTREKQVSQWEIVTANTVRVTTSGTRSLIILAFDKDFTRFVQMGGGAAPIAGVRGKRVPMHLPSPIARFTFNGTESEAGADLRNVQKHDGVLDLAGTYEFHDKAGTGERVMLSVPELDFQAFTVAIHLRPDGVGGKSYPLLMAGESGRWLGLNVSPAGGLSLGLNNGMSGYHLPGVAIKSGEWTTLAVSCDLKARRISLYLNGKNVANVALPPDFNFNVIGESYEQSDKAWTFTDYGCGESLKGLVNEQVVYNRVLLEVQIENLNFSTRLPNKTP